MSFDWTSVRNFFLRPRLWFIIGIVFILYSFVFERSGFIRQYQLKRENQKLQLEVAAAKERLKFLQKEVKALQHDIERIKQEAIRMGYAEPDEVIVHIRE